MAIEPFYRNDLLLLRDAFKYLTLKLDPVLNYTSFAEQIACIVNALGKCRH